MSNDYTGRVCIIILTLAIRNTGQWGCAIAAPLFNNDLGGGWVSTQDYLASKPMLFRSHWTLNFGPTPP